LMSNDGTCGCNGFKTDPLSGLMKVSIWCRQTFPFVNILSVHCRCMPTCVKCLGTFGKFRQWNRIELVGTIWNSWKMEIVGKVGTEWSWRNWKKVLRSFFLIVPLIIHYLT
jgi:hypothetical protein